MHGPRRADLERSNQAAQEQSARPEGTPPHLAGKRAKACPLAISLAADWFERTSRPSSYTPKSGRSRGSRHAPEFPGTRAHYSRGRRYCKPEARRGFAAVRSTRSFIHFSGEHGAASPSVARCPSPLVTRHFLPLSACQRFRFESPASPLAALRQLAASKTSPFLLLLS